MLTGSIAPPKGMNAVTPTEQLSHDPNLRTRIIVDPIHTGDKTFNLYVYGRDGEEIEAALVALRAVVTELLLEHNPRTEPWAEPADGVLACKREATMNGLIPRV